MGTVLKRIKKSTENYEKLVENLKQKFVDIAGANTDEALTQLKEKIEEISKSSLAKSVDAKMVKQERNKRKAERKKSQVDSKARSFSGASRSR
jgi:flavorubredoxin